MEHEEWQVSYKWVVMGQVWSFQFAIAYKLYGLIVIVGSKMYFRMKLHCMVQ